MKNSSISKVHPVSSKSDRRPTADDLNSLHSLPEMVSSMNVIGDCPESPLGRFRLKDLEEASLKKLEELLALKGVIVDHVVSIHEKRKIANEGNVYEVHEMKADSSKGQLLFNAFDKLKYSPFLLIPPHCRKHSIAVDFTSNQQFFKM